jgi:hypothetical protein
MSWNYEEGELEVILVPPGADDDRSAPAGAT